MLNKYLKYIFIFLGVLYCIGAGALYLKQDDLLFLPHPLDDNHVYRDGEEVSVPVEEGINLSCVNIQKPSSKGIILYLHGNKGNIRRCLRQAYQFDVDSFDLFMPDYRGFGKSDGVNTSEAQMIGDVQAVFDFIVGEYQPKHIIVAGYSLGSGLASYLASKNQVDALFLVAPYTSLSDVKDMNGIPVPDFLMKYDFPSVQYLKDVHVPVTVIHAPDDEVIPFSCSETLKDNYPEKINLIQTSSVGHRGVIFDPLINTSLINQLKSIQLY
jgi:pimeloyl-ACP methyl ester carboxylesterase